MAQPNNPTDNNEALAAERARALKDFEADTRGSGRSLGDRLFAGLDRQPSAHGNKIYLALFMLICTGALFAVLFDWKNDKPNVAVPFDVAVDRNYGRFKLEKPEPQKVEPPAKVADDMEEKPPAIDPEEEARRKQMEAMRLMRLKSGIIITGTAGTAAGGPAAVGAADGGVGGFNGPNGLNGLNGQTRGGTQQILMDPTTGKYFISNQPPQPNNANERFLQDKSGQGKATVQAGELQDLPYTVLQGKMVDAVLETPISSDLPGMLRAKLSTDIYGEQGRIALLPQGSTLIGQYNTLINKGQIRVFVIWNRVIRPDGIDIMLDSPGTDQLGRAGLVGEVDNHYLQIFGTSAMLSLVGAGAANIGVNAGDQRNSASAYREALQQNFAQSASRALDRYIDIPPTIHVNQGERIKVFVNRDLDFSGVYAIQRDRAKPMFVMVR